MIGVDQLMAAMAAWEQAEFPTSSVPRAANFHAFQYYPEEADVAAGLKYPYSCHAPDTSDGAEQSVNQTPSVEDEQTHVVWVTIIFGDDASSLAMRSKNSSLWRDAYRTAFLKHLAQGIAPFDGSVMVQSKMGTIRNAAFDLFNRSEVGIEMPITICVRQDMQTGL